MVGAGGAGGIGKKQHTFAYFPVLGITFEPLGRFYSSILKYVVGGGFSLVLRRTVPGGTVRPAYGAPFRRALCKNFLAWHMATMTPHWLPELATHSGHAAYCTLKLAKNKPISEWPLVGCPPH